MIITIGGNVGAGKTTLVERLAGKLGYEELYMGGIFRDMAAERDVSIEEFYLALKHEPDLEVAADKRQEELMNKKDNLVVQGRIAWYFAKTSPFKVFNIFLAVDPEIGAIRTGRRPENSGRDAAEMLLANNARTAAEHERYRSLYAIEDFLDPAHYDFVLDTSHLSEDEVLQKILAEIASVRGDIKKS